MESEIMYINTKNSAISMSDSTKTDSKCNGQNERVKQKRENACAVHDSAIVELTINHNQSQTAAYHALDNGDISPQYEELNNVPAVIQHNTIV